MPEGSAIESTPVESVRPVVKKNPFGLEAPVVDTVRQQEIAEGVRLLRNQTERNKLLKEDKIPVEEMTPSEKAAYLLKHLKD